MEYTQNLSHVTLSWPFGIRNFDVVAFEGKKVGIQSIYPLIQSY